jgi:SAM-dependent methyltransferase
MPTTGARYDGVAEWFDRELATSPLAEDDWETVARLLGSPGGSLLDVGCGTGTFGAALGRLGWTVTGVDVSEDQLRLAQARGVDVVLADAGRLPFEAGTFDAAISTWTHTDIDDFPAVLAEVARVLRPGSPFVYLGAHPCFVGPHSRFVGAEGVPELHPGYRETSRYTEAPGISPVGLRARVGATHLPLGLFVQAFTDAGFALEHFEEPEDREYPYKLALRWRNGSG